MYDKNTAFSQKSRPKNVTFKLTIWIHDLNYCV